jgi:hypothetical protein
MVSYLATALVAVSFLTASSEAAQWQADYGKALEATRSNDKPLLVVLDKPSDKDSRVDPSLLGEGADQGKDANLLASYELCHVDVSTTYGKKVAKAFRARTFPHLAIIDKTGSTVLFSRAGKMKADQWENTLASYKKGTRGLVSRVSYKMGDDSPAFETPSESQHGKSYCPSCQRKNH